MKCRLSFLVGVPVILGLCLLGISNQVTSQQKEQEKTRPKPFTGQRAESESNAAFGGKKPPIDGKPVDKKPIDKKPTTLDDTIRGVDVAGKKPIDLKPPIDGKPVDKKPIDKKPV
jgi:hypothetical protein